MQYFIHENNKKSCIFIHLLPRFKNQPVPFWHQFENAIKQKNNLFYEEQQFNSL